jgi:hypothetical protein
MKHALLVASRDLPNTFSKHRQMVELKKVWGKI